MSDTFKTDIAGRRIGAQPTASVDAEPVAWLYTHPGAKPLLRHSRFPMSVPGWTETPLYTEAQMQARADAARREVLDRIAALEAKLAEKDAQLAEARDAALEEAAEVAEGTLGIRATAIRALKGSQQ